jgi:hypothetical protein
VVEAKWVSILQQGQKVTAFAQIVDIKNRILSDNPIVGKYAKNVAQE